MRSIDDYLALIPSYNRSKPNFNMVVELLLQPWADLQQFLASDLEFAFDLDTAIGVQLDAVGVRVGRSRQVPIPLSNPWFALDDPIRCLDRAPWKGPFNPGNYLALLDDDTYRLLLRSKIIANYWDSSVDVAQQVLNVYFSNRYLNTNVWIEDDGMAVGEENWFALDDPYHGLDVGVWKPVGSTQGSAFEAVDMVMSVNVSGVWPSIVDLEVLGQGLLPVKPEAVRINYYVTSVNNTPLFGLDAENAFISGLDVGSWGVSPDYINSHAA